MPSYSAQVAQVLPLVALLSLLASSVYLTFLAAGSSVLNSGRSAPRLVVKRVMASGARVAPSNSLRTNCRRDESSSAAMISLLSRGKVVGPCSERIYLERIRDVLHDSAILRLGLRWVTLQHLAIPPDQELLEVPGDLASYT